MSELIKRTEVIELIKNSHYDLANSEDDMWAMVADVEKLPVIDLIRCKDCKFFQINKFDDTYLDMMCTENYDCYGAYMSTRPDEFCSNAERKEE
jgi:hypothetical protein